LRKSLQTDRRTDDGRRAIALAHFWNELKIVHIYYYYLEYEKNALTKAGERKCETCLSLCCIIFRNYDSNIKSFLCLFTLFAAKVIKLRVIRLLLEASSDCSKDRLDIYDGWTVDGGLNLGRLCGSDLPAQPYVTDTNVAVVSFTSDEAGADAGFSVEYQPQVPGVDLPDSSTDNSQSKSTRLTDFLISLDVTKRLYHS